MRTIKFRAWDENYAEMIYEVGITPEGIPYSIPDYAEESDQFNYYPTCHKMQFTGLHDKNGREIYEGDIVRINGLVFEVIVNDFTQEWVIDGETGQERLSYAHKKCKVIGNIYENPELLK